MNVEIGPDSCWRVFLKVVERICVTAMGIVSGTFGCSKHWWGQRKYKFSNPPPFFTIISRDCESRKELNRANSLILNTLLR
jgi:hypothetical protein